MTNALIVDAREEDSCDFGRQRVCWTVEGWSMGCTRSARNGLQPVMLVLVAKNALLPPVESDEDSGS